MQITRMSMVRDRPGRYSSPMRNFATLFRRFALLLGLGFGLTRPATAQDAFASAWSKAPGAAMRIIAASGERAAIEVKLDPNTITYWRNPGETGVPPQFTFSGSDNIDTVEVLYPAPRRFDEAGVFAYGYAEAVVFPLHVTRHDPQRPATLDVKLDYATCSRICAPAVGTGRLQLPSGEDGGPHAVLIARAERQVPRPVEAGRFEITAAPEPRQWIVEVRDMTEWGLEPAAAELFVEGPDGWYFDAQRLAEPGRFQLRLTARPAARATRDLALTVTLAAANRAVETRLHLDAGQISP
jgi:DsbC/DsbD-like thiol-disulfide interchange protein